MLQKIGEDWIVDLSQLRRLEPFVNDVRFMQEFIKAKQVSDFIYKGCRFCQGRVESVDFPAGGGGEIFRVAPTA